jgi:transposase-like protein
MAIINEIFCINNNCKDYGIKNLGNIRTRGKYGKSKKKQLLYCQTCGQRFSYSRSTAFFGLRIPEEKITQVIEKTADGVGIREIGRQLEISKDTAHRVVLKAEKHCEVVLENLLASLKIDRIQAGTLLSFIEKRRILKK